MRLPDPRAFKSGRDPTVRLRIGDLGDRRILLGWAGAGAQPAARAATVLLEEGVGALLAAGFAGALAPDLRPGDIVAAFEVIEPDGTRWTADPDLLARCPPESATFHRGPLLTIAHVVPTATEKRRLREETGAVAVDMESAAVARCAAGAGAPFLALRVITDAADECLPLDFNLCFDSNGQFHRARLLPLLARRPAAVPGLIRLGRHSAFAGRSLATFLSAYIARVAGEE